MKQKYFLKLILSTVLFFQCISSYSQARGEIAFVGFNADGDDDFSIVALADIAAATTIYIKDSGSGRITWSTGAFTINAGTVITFTDVDGASNPFLGVSIGSITKSGPFNWSASGETILIYLGTDSETPTTHITGMRNSTTAADLTGTGLTSGTDFLLLNATASPDGGAFTGSRNNKTSFDLYLPDLVNPSNWSSSSSAGENFIPFSGEYFSLTGTTVNTWTGATSSDWQNPGNWTASIPSSSSIVTIPNVGNPPIISSGSLAQAANLTIETGQTLTINSTNSLTVNGLLTITGDLTINSGGSLITKGNTTGNLTYNVNVNDTDWHLVSSPVVDEQYDDTWNTANLIDVSGTGNNDAVSTYDNSTDADGNWDYFQTGGASTTFNQGQGYSLKRTASGDYSFTGTKPSVGFEKAITMAQEGLAGENRWNLVGNPFPAYINIATFLSDNATPLTNTHESIYVWNGTNYQALTTGHIHTGQAFFVNSNAASTDLVFTTSQLSHQTGVTFYKNVISSIVLSINDNSITKATKINYSQNKTTSLDPRFDIGTFTGTLSRFSIYSHLISNSEGVDFMIQSLPKDYENLVIPIGVNAESGKKITFTAETLNLPSDIKVFLEDREANSFIRLDEANSEYKITLSQNLNRIGRFYLHTTGSILNVDTVNLDNISIYKPNASTLRIVGLQQGNTNVTLFNILGKQMIKTSFTSNGVKDISLPKLAKGVYIVQLQTDAGKLNKKIILE